MSAIDQSAPVIDKANESFRDKVIRKCGESVEMKEKFFNKYADSLDTMSRGDGGSVSEGGPALCHGQRR
jgi:hypothetical protein